MTTSINIRRVAQEAILPVRAHPDDAGLDLYTVEGAILAPRQGKAMKTGIAMAVPQGHVGLIADRSSMAKKGIKTAGGVIDAGYRGEVLVMLWNISNDEIRINAGERIAQLLLLPIITPAVTEVQVLDETPRGDGGFGSTGK